MVILLICIFNCHSQSGTPISLYTPHHLRVQQDHRRRTPFATLKFIRPFYATIHIIRITPISLLAAPRRTRSRSAMFPRIRNCCVTCPSTAIIRNTPPAVLRPRSSPSATLTSRRGIRASFAISSDIRTIRNIATPRQLDNNPTLSATYPDMCWINVTSPNIRIFRTSRQRNRQCKSKAILTLRHQMTIYHCARFLDIQCCSAMSVYIQIIQSLLIRNCLNSLRLLLDWFAQSPAINTAEVLCLLSVTCNFHI
jgi:hypothetical protein